MHPNTTKITGHAVFSRILKGTIAAAFGLIWGAKQFLGLQLHLGFLRVPMDVPVAALIVVAIVAWLWRERKSHSHALSGVPVRIHITGIRGKTTTTRLIGYALRESGRAVVTKTTGKAATIIASNGIETPVPRRGGNKYLPTIKEQTQVIDYAHRAKADALVLECMAIRPDLITAERRIVQPTIAVITNVRTDHLDVLGPTLDDVARNLCEIIPPGGLVVTAERDRLGLIEKSAAKRSARVIAVDESSVSESCVGMFPYLNFRENIAIALEVAGLLGIDRDVAFRGMLGAPPDVGMIETYTLDHAKRIRLVSAFGVNDVESTIDVYNRLSRSAMFDGASIFGLFHSRSDRITRSVDFARGIGGMDFNSLFVFGEATSAFTSRLDGEWHNGRLIDLGKPEVRKIAQLSEWLPNGSVVFGFGNRVGLEPILDELKRRTHVNGGLVPEQAEVVAPVAL